MDDLKIVEINSVKFAVLQEFSIDGVDYNLVWSPTTRELAVELDTDCVELDDEDDDSADDDSTDDDNSDK